MIFGVPNPVYGLNKVGLWTDVEATTYLWTITSGVGELLEDDKQDVVLKVEANNAPQTVTVQLDADGSIFSADISHLEKGTNPDNPNDGYVLINSTIVCNCC